MSCLHLSEGIVEDKRLSEFSHQAPRLLMSGSSTSDTQGEKANIHVYTERVTVTFAPEYRLSRATALASEETLGKLWDTPEEDEAWRDL